MTTFILLLPTLLLQNFKINCASGNVEYKIEGGEFTTGRTFPDLPAVTTYTLTVKVTNNKGLSSEISVDVRTGELGKCDQLTILAMNNY